MPKGEIPRFKNVPSEISHDTIVIYVVTLLLLSYFFPRQFYSGPTKNGPIYRFFYL